MDDEWCLPGYEVHGPIGSSSDEDLWRGRELASGQTVVLCRRSAEEGGEALDAWQREAAQHASLTSPHVVRLRAVVPQGDVVVLVRDHAGGGALDVLLARRRHLEPGEVVTIGVALAHALAALTAAGLAPGRLSPEQVLFRSDGMPLLAPRGGGATPSEADPRAEVVALAALCSRLAGTAAPSGLRAVLSAGADRALDAEDFAVALRRAHEPSPVLRGGASPTAVPAHPPTPTSPGPGEVPATTRPLHPVERGRPGAWPVPSPRVLLAAALVLLVVVGALAGVWSGRGGGGSRPAGTVASASPASAAPAHARGAPDSAGEWAAVLDRLDAARAVAFGQADVALLGAVYVQGSPGQEADARLVRSLARRGLTAQDVRHRVGDVEVVRASQDRVRLRVVDTLAGYDVRNGAGEVVAQATARGRRSHVVDLERTARGWRLVEVRRG